MLRAALLALLLSGCAADWMDRSALSAVDQANLTTLHDTCEADLLFPSAGPREMTARASYCADVTHRMLCHARVGPCP